MLTRSKSKSTSNQLKVNREQIVSNLFTSLNMSNSSAANSESVATSNDAILKNLEASIERINLNHDNLNTDYLCLKRKIKSMENYNYEIDRSLTALEKELSLLAQYGRRESIEILGIPAKVKQNKLEETVINILGTIGVVVESIDIVAVHRLKVIKNGKPPSTIVRFINRKNAFDALKNKKELHLCEETLGFKSLFIVENLCPVFKSLFEKCRSLKYEHKIKHLWTHNGIINIRLTDNRKENPIRLYHDEDFDYYFPSEEPYEDRVSTDEEEDEY